MSALNTPVTYNFSSGRFTTRDVSMELVNLRSSSLNFQRLLDDIPSTIPNTGRDNGYPLREIVITDDPRGFGLAGVTTTEATYVEGGRIFIFLDPNLAAVDRASGREWTIGEILTHALAHHTESAIAATGSAREAVAIEYQNTVAEGLGLPTATVGGQSFPQRSASDPIRYFFDANPRCFLAGTPILMGDGSEKPIEQVRPGDLVMAFDETAENGRGKLVPRRVTRTFENTTDTVIDLRGLHVTPGHVFLSGDGGFAKIADILKADGTIVDKNGQVIRARTGAKAGSPDDALVQVAFDDPASGRRELAVVRAAIPCMRRAEDGALCSLGYLLKQFGAEVLTDGMVRAADGTIAVMNWPEGSTPFDTEVQCNFIVCGINGQPYLPEWIATMSDAGEGQLRVVNGPPGALALRSAPRLSTKFTPKLVASRGDAPVNRRQRRKAFALERVK